MLCLAATFLHAEENSAPPVRFAIVGLVHDHFGGLVPHLKQHPETQLVGIVEPNAAVASNAVRRLKLDPNIIFPSLEGSTETIHQFHFS